MFQQHQDESLYDAWTRFKNLIQRVPHHGLDLWSLAQFFYDHVDRYTQIDINYAARGNLMGLSAEEAWVIIEDCAQCDRLWKNPTSTISDQTIANQNAQIVGDDMVRVHVPRCMAWLDYDEHVDGLSTMDNEVGVTSPESTTQTLPSFEEYIPPVTYPEEVVEIIGIPIEVEPLDHTKLEDLDLNTCNHDLPLSSREFPNVDEPVPQPLPNLQFLDVSLGDVKGPEPPIKPHSPDSFRMKVVDN